MLSSSSSELSVLELQVSRSLAWYSVWSFAVQYETHEMWFEATSSWKLQSRVFILNVTRAVSQLIFNVQRTLESKIIYCQLYICTCMYVWLITGLPLEWMTVYVDWEHSHTWAMCFWYIHYRNLLAGSSWFLLCKRNDLLNYQKKIK